MPVRIEGYVDNGRGAPAAGIPAVATRLSDGVVVDTTVTDADGYWLFTGLAPADEHLVTLTDTAGNAVARAPWSGELREAYVRDRLDVTGKPVLLDPAAGNALLWTATGLYAPTGITLAAADLRYEPLDSAYTKAEADARYEPFDSAYTKAEADARYPQKTDIDPYPTYLTSTEGNATYLPLTGGALSGPLTIQSKAVGVSATGGNTLAWNADGFYVAAGAVTDIWVDVLGDTMTGVLNMAANVLPTTTNTRDLGSTTLRWRKVWATDIDATNAPTVGGSALLTTAAGDLRYEPIDTMYTKAEDDARFVQLTGGSVMTGLLGPTTNNTRDLGTTALRWRKLWAVDGEFTNVPTVGGVALLTATAADALFLTPAEGNAAYATAAHNHDATYVKLVGGSVMTGLLGPTTTNVNDLGTSTLRWRKLWGVDADLSGAATVAGVISNGAAAPYTLLTDVTNGRVWVNARNTSRGPMYYSGPALIVQTEHTDGAMILNIQGYGMGTGAPQFGIYRAKGTSASPTDLSNGDWLGSIDYWGYGGGAFRESVRLIGIADGAPGATWVPGQLSVRVVDSAGTLTERLRVNSAGVVNAVTALSVNSRPVIMAGCRVYHNTTHTLTTAVALALAFNTERYDTDNFHDNVTNNTRLTVPAGHAGKYLIIANIAFAANATGHREVAIRINGAAFLGIQDTMAVTTGGSFTVMTVNTTYDLAVGDYVEVVALQTSGGNLNTVAAVAYSPEFSMQRIG